MVSISTPRAMPIRAITPFKIRRCMESEYKPVNIRVLSERCTLRQVMLLMTPKELPLGEIMHNLPALSRAIADHLALECLVVESTDRIVVAFMDIMQ